MAWHEQRLSTFDVESTGVDPETARIVTACVALVGGGKPPHITNWLSDVNGEEIPAEAAQIHGISTEKARAEGRPAAEVIDQIVEALAQVVTEGIPVVAMNARYDFTVLDREARRHGIRPLVDIVGDNLRVIDPYVLDKQVDRYRKGRRTLTHLCEHYQVTLDGAHSSDADAVAAARVAWRIGVAYPQIGETDLVDLHKQQITWAAEQAASLESHLRRMTPDVHVEQAWPLVPFGGDQ